MLIRSQYEIYKFFMFLVNNFAVDSSEFGLDVEDYLIGECSKCLLALIVCFCVMITSCDEYHPLLAR